MSKTKKILAVFLVVTSLFVGFGPASAVTIEDLLAQIAALQAQLAALQASSGGSSAVCLTKDLYYPMKDDQVKVLQGWLSVSPQSGYFGPLTKAAVIAYQKANSIAPVAGYVGPLTRASLNAKYCSTTPSPTTTPAPAGSVSVALSPTTAAAATLVANSTSTYGAQALADMAAFRFTAPAGSAVSVTKVALHRAGVSADADVSNLYLYVNGAKVADAPSISSGYFTFTNSAGLFTVPAGSYVDLMVKMDLANGTSAGKTLQFGIVAASDVASNATTVSGSFPMTGNTMTVAQVSDLGRMTIQTALPSSNSTVDAGTTNYEVFRFSAVANNQPQQVSYMKFTLVGTADYDALQNVKLFVDGSQVGSTASLMSSDKTVVFDLSGSPLAFTSGQTRTISLRADVVKGSGRNFYFEVARSADFVTKDTTYGVYLKVNDSNVFTLFAAAGVTSINAGTVIVGRSTSSPTGPLTANATNVMLASFDVKAVGEDIRVSSLSIQLTSTHTVNNVKMVVDGSQYGATTATLATATTQAYSGTYTFPAGVTKTVAVYADLTSAVVSGDSITVTFKQGSANGVLQSSGSSVAVPGADTAGNALAITAGGVTAVMNSSVANVSSVINASNILMGSWLVSAPTDQGISINGITINDSGNQGIGSAFSNLTLWNGSTQYGQTISSPSSTQGTAQTFNFGTKLAVSAGQSVQFDLKANVLSTASTSQWNGAAGDGISVTSVDATGSTTNSAVTYSSGTVAGQLITLNTGATLTVATEASPTMPYSSYLVAGDTGVTLAAFRFTADNTEDVKVTQVKVNETGADDVPGNLKNITLYVDGVQVGSTVPALINSASNTATFSNSAGLFTVPKNSYKTLVVKSDMTDKSNATFADAGKAQKISVYVKNAASSATTDIVATGSTSSQYVTLAGGSAGGTYLNGNAMTFVRSKPTFAYVAPASTTLTPGTMEVLRFNITAASDDDVKFNSTASNIIRLTILAGKTGSTGTVTLYDANNDSVLASSTAANLASGQTVSFAFGSGSITIPAGTTKQFYVKADLSTFSTLGNSFQVQIANAAADMSFNDSSSTTANISAANYVGLGLPISGAIFVKP